MKSFEGFERKKEPDPTEQVRNILTKIYGPRGPVQGNSMISHMSIEDLIRLTKRVRTDPKVPPLTEAEMKVLDIFESSVSENQTKDPVGW